MDVRVTARRVRMTPTAKRQLQARLEKLRRYVPELSRADVKVSAEKHRVAAEVLLRVRQKDRIAIEEAGDLQSALDGAVDRLEHQLRRLKEKGSRSSARVREAGPLRRSATRVALATSDRPARGAAGRSKGNARTAEGRAAVVRQRMPGGKPLSLEEAVERLVASSDEFLVFLDSRSERPCILYRRKDGRLAVVEARA